MYAVLDVETTGLNPGWKHRIAEVAIVLVDQYGRIEQEWCSLVNPQRDLGPQHIHGIRAADVRHAPTFDGLASQIAELLAGRVIVAHNLSFDAMFLRSEFDRLGVTVPVRQDLGLCTMALAAQYLPATGRSLQECCRTAGIEMDGWHSALSDARAAARLLRVYVTAAADPPPWLALLMSAPLQQWPALPPTTATPVTRPARRRGDQPFVPEDFLSRLVERLPRVPQPPRADMYLAVLDHALRDQHISESEADELIGLATDFGLDRRLVLRLHHGYLAELARAAVADGMVTDAERHDLRTAAMLLGLGADAADAALTAASSPEKDDDAEDPYPSRFRLQPGDRVVLTGQMSEPREVWENRGRAAGLDMNGNSVSSRTRLLVAADRDSWSGKARKARDCGVPVVTEETFGRLIADLRARNARTGEFT